MANLLKFNEDISNMDVFVRTEAKAARDGFQRAKDALENLSEAFISEKYKEEIAGVNETERQDLAYNLASVFGAAADYKKELSKIEDIELNL